MEETDRGKQSHSEVETVGVMYILIYLVPVQPG